MRALHRPPLPRRHWVVVHPQSRTALLCLSFQSIKKGVLCCISNVNPRHTATNLLGIRVGVSAYDRTNRSSISITTAIHDVCLLCSANPSERFPRSTAKGL